MSVYVSSADKQFQNYARKLSRLDRPPTARELETLARLKTGAGK